MRRMCFLIAISCLVLLGPPSWAKKKRVGQSGMTYLDISMGARETAMGDAGTASVRGINGLWHNPAVLADISHFAVVFNQVTWLVDTRLYGTAAALRLGNWGTFALDLTYMDLGEIMGTRRVDKSLDPRGFELTGDIGVEDYAIGFSYSRRINDRFCMGVKVKRLHENLGNASYVVSEYEDPDTGEKIRQREEKEWSLNDWGLDFGTYYQVGWNGLVLAMTMQNFSRDMKYWYDEFQLPMTLRIGASMILSDLVMPNERLTMLVAVDATHSNDYTERIHLGTEVKYMNRFFLRGGYKFNHDVESLTLGLGVNFTFAGSSAAVDYAYSSADFFSDVHRVSFYFAR